MNLTREIQGSVFGENIHTCKWACSSNHVFQGSTVLEDMTKLSAEEINQGWFKPMGLCPCYWPGKDTKSNSYNAFPCRASSRDWVLWSLFCAFSVREVDFQNSLHFQNSWGQALLWPFSQSDILSWDLKPPRKVAPLSKSIWILLCHQKSVLVKAMVFQ